MPFQSAKLWLVSSDFSVKHIVFVRRQWQHLTVRDGRKANHAAYWWFLYQRLPVNTDSQHITASHFFKISDRMLVRVTTATTIQQQQPIWLVPQSFTWLVNQPTLLTKQTTNFWCWHCQPSDHFFFRLSARPSRDRSFQGGNPRELNEPVELVASNTKKCWLMLVDNMICWKMFS